jgi:beta-lactamase regulating signal transducer with metallopeptidase domain
MARLDSWVSPTVMHALGWALIHSLWQAVGVAALAAVLMAFSRRPSVRYLAGVGALALMLALPVATFFVLMKSAAPVHALLPANPGALLAARPGPSLSTAPRIVIAYPVAAISGAMGNHAIGGLMDFPRPLPNILSWLVGAWLCGVLFFSLRFAGAFLLVERRRRRQSIALSPRILALCQELQRQIGLNRAIRYLECNWLQVPAVVGWLRPIVFMPAFALTGLSEAQLRAVIAHELAHIRRFDAFVNLFQILVEALLFYHPAMWWLNKRIRAERELACDEIAVLLSGDRLEYAKALTLIAGWARAPALAMAANRGSLSERVFHILGQKPSGTGQRVLGLTGSVLFLAAALGAANALFGIAYPIPAAHAKESVKAALSSSQTAVGHVVGQALAASAPAANDVAPEQVRHGSATVDETAAVDQIKATVNSQSENLEPLPPLLLAAADAPAAAQPASVTPDAAQSIPSGAPESITVTATPLPGRSAVDEFIYSYPTAVRATDKIARWKVGICPTVMGLPQHFADFVNRRLIAIARKAGAPINADPKCRHNIEIVFTTKPQGLADDIHNNHRLFLGPFDNLHQADELAKVTHDIQAWYLTGTFGPDGTIRVDNPRQDFLTDGGDGLGRGRVFYAAGAGRFNNGIGSTLYNVIIAADPTKLGDYEIGALADYIAMLALSQPKSFDACWEVPSITNLLSKDCEADRKTETLSDNDAAFLYGLYKMTSGDNIYIQRDQIRYFMERNPIPQH